MCYNRFMTREEIIDTLRQNEAALRERGVVHAALFGSVARGDSDQRSDIDIMVEIDPQARITLFGYARLKNFIAGLFQAQVDVVDRKRLKDFIRPGAERDAVHAF